MYNAVSGTSRDGVDVCRLQKLRTPDIKLGMMHGYRRLKDFVASKRN